MRKLSWTAVIATIVLTASCVGDRSRDAKSQNNASHPPAVGGGPRDPYPDWCSAYQAPVPPEMNALPKPDAPQPTGLDPCPSPVPPIGPPPPVPPAVATPK